MPDEKKKEPEKWRNREWEIKKGEPLINKVTLREINPAWATYAEQEIARLTSALERARREAEEAVEGMRKILSDLRSSLYRNDIGISTIKLRIEECYVLLRGVQR